MTYLLPCLSALKNSDPSVSSRFSSMAANILESCESHPGVIFEGFVFFERLCANCHLLSGENSLSVPFTGDVIASFMPYILSVLRPIQPSPLAEYSKRGIHSCQGSIVCQRAAIKCLRLFLVSSAGLHGKKIMTNYILHAQLMTLLEYSCGIRHFHHAALYRGLSAPRDAERSTIGNAALEIEVVSAIEELLSTEVLHTQDDSKRLLRLLLFARSLIAGVFEGQAQEESETLSRIHYTLLEVTQGAKLIAQQDASLIPSLANPPRWQVKCEAAKIASMALVGISKRCQSTFEDKVMHQCPDFNLNVAHSLVTKKCHDTNTAGSTLPPPQFLCISAF